MIHLSFETKNMGLEMRLVAGDSLKRAIKKSVPLVLRDGYIPRYHPDSCGIAADKALYNVLTYAFPVTGKSRRYLPDIFSTALQGGASSDCIYRLAPNADSLP